MITTAVTDSEVITLLLGNGRVHIECLAAGEIFNDQMAVPGVDRCNKPDLTLSAERTGKSGIPGITGDHHQGAVRAG